MSLFRLNCPHCNVVLNYIPRKAKKCRNCNKTIYPNNINLDNNSNPTIILMTKKEADQFIIKKEFYLRATYRKEIYKWTARLISIQEKIRMSEDATDGETMGDEIYNALGYNNWVNSWSWEDFFKDFGEEARLAGAEKDRLEVENVNKYVNMFNLEKAESEIIKKLTELKFGFNQYCKVFELKESLSINQSEEE